MARRKSSRSVASRTSLDAKAVRPPPPAARAGPKPRASNASIDARVAMIARALADGLTRPLILDAVALQQKDEIERRTAARGATPAPTAQEIARLVPAIWGDKPIPTRTIDYYIAKARVSFAEELANGVRSPRAIRGLQVARLTNVYRKAIEKDQFGAALKATEHLARQLRRPYGYLTPPRARFARLIVAGKSVADAYRLSHPGKLAGRGQRSIENEAYRIMRLPAMALKIAELQERADQNAVVTWENHVARLGEIRDAAFDAGQYAAATSAEVARAKASGLLVDEVNVNVRGSVAAASNDVDLSRLSLDELAQLERILLKAQSDEPVVHGSGVPTGLARIAAVSTSSGNGNGSAHCAAEDQDVA